MVLKEETLGERFCEVIFRSACFASVKNTRLSVVMINGEERGLAVVWFAKMRRTTMIEKGKGVSRGKLSLGSKSR